MKIYRALTIDIETGKVLAEDAYEYSGPLALCDRAAQSAASNAAGTAGNTASGLGASANGISANLTPFLTQELLHPQGYSQSDLAAQTSSALAGAGGATSGITGEANLMAARARNPGGFTSALDEAARDRSKAAAGVSEQIAAKNADVKQQQQQSAAQQLGSLYGTDTDAMLKSMGLQNQDIQTQLQAGQSGWLQNLSSIMGMINGGGGAAAQMLSAVKDSGASAAG